MAQGWGGGGGGYGPPPGGGGYGPPPGPGGYGPPPAPGGYGPPPGAGFGAPPGYGQGYGASGPLMKGGMHGMPMSPQCQRCGGMLFPYSKISAGGWIVFALLLFFFLPLCWIGLLIKERGMRCGSCHAVTGPMGY